MHQKHHINLVSYEKRYHSDGAGGGKRAAADKDKKGEEEDEEEKGGESPKKRARMAAVAKAGVKEVRAKVDTRRTLATERCVLCDNAFPLPKLFGHVTSRHHVAADRYERVKLALLATCDRGEQI